ncbi:MAG: divalent-cation tolerance protein CutA [Aigarchaeota archaeon]|nr:divalent-cation tolerance protein CutA [Aigarchaeota archaeon]MCX8192989.1 divalent-cation tolerance protein CutA [Nitrososphaeria archaeon]MDW7986275.1 divalent-cation tolerance protein CutA [Nitrososphaerota archaeon]
MSKYIQVLTTIDSEAKAEEIAKRLLRDRLAACVQIIGPIKSMYWWKDQMEEAREWICLIKTESSKYADIENTIKEVHSYEVPEIIALPIISGYSRYLEWISNEVKKDKKS